MSAKKTETIRLRVEENWKEELELFAKLQKMSLSDFVRFACDDLRARHSQPLRSTRMMSNVTG